MKSWQFDLMLLVGAVLGLMPALLGGGGIIGPAAGPRVVVTVVESSQSTPERGAMLAKLRTSTNWGESKYLALEADHAAAKTLVEKHPGDSLHIGTMKADGKLGDLLYSGPLPKTDAEVTAKWRSLGGK